VGENNMSESEDGNSEDEGAKVEDEPSGRQQYSNKCELMLSLVGYAVGLGNIWRFPSLCFENGGAAFLIPYFTCLIFLGVPLFVLELGLGQTLREGTLGVWKKMGMPRFQGVGVAATICTFNVSLYYIVILTWTVYFVGRTVMTFGTGILPWTEDVPGFTCPDTYVYTKRPSIINNGLLPADISSTRETYHCPANGDLTWANETMGMAGGYTKVLAHAAHCPGYAAIKFWETEVLWQSTGMDNLGGIHYGLLAAYTVCWLGCYGIICKGVQSSGKVVYVTALLPYVALVAFFVRAITLPNMSMGLKFFLLPEWDKIFYWQAWIRAGTQIFYSLGVGFGSLIAFASYGDKHDDFVGNAIKVASINAGTSIFAGFVVFPILGYLAYEMSEVNPCFSPDSMASLEAVGLSGTSLAFVAFPIAISKMYGSYFWALLFFVLLICLGIDSEFAMLESVMTVIHDAGWGGNLSKPKLAAVVCGVSYFLGLIFITRGGIYWFNLFDYYSCIVALFFVTLMECIGVMWSDKALFPMFKAKVKNNTGITLSGYYSVSWKWTCPIFICVLLFFSCKVYDVMAATTSEPYPEGEGYLPGWSVLMGWKLGLLPILGFIIALVCAPGELTTHAPHADLASGSEDEADMKE
jgi:SNF family Na+-dependent transporter